MKVKAWSQQRPFSAWLPITEDRRFVDATTIAHLVLPKVDEHECNVCRLCWIYCPEGAIACETNHVTFDYEDCRGCGLCAYECPRDAIKMVEALK